MNMKNIALSGGGIKGMAYIGLLKAFYENDDFYNNIECFSGASVGSIFATFLILKIPFEHIEQFVNIKYDDHFSLDFDNLIEDFGLDNCNNFIQILSKCLGEYSDITLKEIYNNTGKKLFISATCLDNYSVEYFNYESHPNLKVIDAIRASMAIPVLYTVVTINNKKYIDGSVLEPIPLSIFDIKDTLGILICDKENKEITINSFSNYIFNLIKCIKFKMDSLYGYENKYEILKIHLEDIEFIDFHIDMDKKQKMINIGYEITKKYLTKY